MTFTEQSMSALQHAAELADKIATEEGGADITHVVLVRFAIMLATAITEALLEIAAQVRAHD